MPNVEGTYRRENLITPRDSRNILAALSATTNHSISTIDYLIAKYGPTLTPTQVGEITNRHPSHIRNLCSKGVLPGMLLGSRWVIPTAKLAELIDNGFHQ